MSCLGLGGFLSFDGRHASRERLYFEVLQNDVLALGHLLLHAVGRGPVRRIYFGL